MNKTDLASYADDSARCRIVSTINDINDNPRTSRSAKTYLELKLLQIQILMNK